MDGDDDFQVVSRGARPKKKVAVTNSPTRANPFSILKAPPQSNTPKQNRKKLKKIRDWQGLSPEIVGLFFRAENRDEKTWLAALRLTCKSWGAALCYADFTTMQVRRLSVPFLSTLVSKRKRPLRNISVCVEEIPFIRGLLSKICSDVVQLTLTSQKTNPRKQTERTEAQNSAVVRIQNAWNLFGRLRCGEGWNGSDFMVTSGETWTLDEVAETIKAQTGAKVHVEYGPKDIVSSERDIIYVFPANNADSDSIWGRIADHEPLYLTATPPLKTDYTVEEILQPLLTLNWPLLDSIVLSLEGGLKIPSGVVESFFQRATLELDISSYRSPLGYKFLGKFCNDFSSLFPYLTKVTFPQDFGYDSVQATDFEFNLPRAEKIIHFPDMFRVVKLPSMHTVTFCYQWDSHPVNLRSSPYLTTLIFDPFRSGDFPDLHPKVCLEALGGKLQQVQDFLRQHSPEVWVEVTHLTLFVSEIPQVSQIQFLHQFSNIRKLVFKKDFRTRHWRRFQNDSNSSETLPFIREVELELPLAQKIYPEFFPKSKISVFSDAGKIVLSSDTTQQQWTALAKTYQPQKEYCPWDYDWHYESPVDWEKSAMPLKYKDIGWL